MADIYAIPIYILPIAFIIIQNKPMNRITAWWVLLPSRPRNNGLMPPLTGNTGCCINSYVCPLVPPLAPDSALTDSPLAAGRAALAAQ